MGLSTSAAHFQRFVERKLRKHGLLYERCVLNGHKDEQNQAEESREPIDIEVDDDVACECSAGDTPGAKPVLAHNGCCSVTRMT